LNDWEKTICRDCGCGSAPLVMVVVVVALVVVVVPGNRPRLLLLMAGPLLVPRLRGVVPLWLLVLPL